MIIKRYIYKELLYKSIWILGLLILLITSSKFVKFLAAAAEGNLPEDLLLLILAYKIIATLPKLLPISIFIAALLVFSRLATDRELVVFAASGISRLFQLIATVKFAAVFGGIAAVIILYLAPLAERNMQQLKLRVAQEADFSGIKPGHFKELSKGYVLYVHQFSADKETMEQVFLQISAPGKKGILTADSAYFYHDPQTGEQYIIFNNGHRYASTPGSLHYQITEYAAYKILVDIPKVSTGSGKPASLSTAALIGSESTIHQAELQWRLSLVIACLLLPLLALLLVQFKAKPHQTFIISIIIYLLYSNLLGIAKTLVKKGLVTDTIGLWWVHGLLVIVLVLLYYLPHHRQSKPAALG